MFLHDPLFERVTSPGCRGVKGKNGGWGGNPSPTSTGTQHLPGLRIRKIKFIDPSSSLTDPLKEQFPRLVLAGPVIPFSFVSSLVSGFFPPISQDFLGREGDEEGKEEEGERLISTLSPPPSKLSH